MMKDVEYLQFLWPMRHYLITSGDIDKNPNIIAVSFCMPVSKKPPLTAIAIGVNSYSYKLINKYREFIINVPLNNLNKQIYYCGMYSGKETDKFKNTGLTPKPSRKLKTPIINECIAFMECLIFKKIKTGDKMLFIGEVIEAYADKTYAENTKKPDYAMGDFPVKIYSTRFN